MKINRAEFTKSADHSGRRFCKLALFFLFLFIFTRAKRGTYRPRAEDVECCICNDLADAYETS